MIDRAIAGAERAVRRSLRRRRTAPIKKRVRARAARTPRPLSTVLSPVAIATCRLPPTAPVITSEAIALFSRSP